jgi:hypothetical protein
MIGDVTMVNNQSITKGWFYSKEYNHFQKVNQEVYCYIESIIGGYQSKLYLRRHTNSCLLEVRSEKKLQELFQMGNEWLTKYFHGNLKIIEKDKYSISNPNGVWGYNNFDKKEYWI